MSGVKRERLKGIDGEVMQTSALSLMLFLCVGPAWAELLPTQDQEEIEWLGVAQGHSSEVVAPLLDQIKRVGERGLPVESLTNKVKEGLAKGIDLGRIASVLRQMTSRLESAHELLQEAGSCRMKEGNRQRAMETMAEALTRGATVDEVRELSRLSQGSRCQVTQEAVAAGAKSLAIMKEGRISSKDGMALLSEEIKQGYRPSEILDLGRYLRRHGSDFKAGLASIKAIREYVSRGERSDRLFREGQSGPGDSERE